MLLESCSRADSISDVKHCLLGGMCDIIARCEAVCVECIRLDAGCLCFCVRVDIMLWHRVGGNVL